MPRKDDASGSQHEATLAAGGGRPRLTLREESAFGLEALARTLDEAALNMSLLALEGTSEAARTNGPKDAADAARRLADQVTTQLKGLEVALAEVVGANRR